MNLRRFLQIYAIAGLIVLAGFWAFYSQRLLKQLEGETLLRSKLYASYVTSPESSAALENVIFEEIVSKIDFPVVITDTAGNPQSFRNVPPKDTTPANLPAFVEKLDRERSPIPIKAVIDIDTLQKDTLTLSVLHYGLPESWTMLRYFPVIQAFFIILFVILGFIYIFASARRDQDRLWVALAREAAHQLGTPVSSLLGWSEFTRTKVDKEVSNEIQADLERIREILDRFARIGDKPRLEPHDIGPLIVHTVEFMRHRAPSKIELSCEIKETRRLLIDPTLISWALENLIRNGIDAIGRKQGSIAVAAGKIEGKKMYEITVTDSGIGIPQGHTKDIFRTGFSTKKHGWGIGLALSRRVIEQLHRGKLRVKSSKAGKTIMSIALPLWHE